MRIRQIKPGWWLDKTLRRELSADAREFYIGLWMLADDAGWIDWDVERVAAELYPFGVSPGGLLGGDPIEARESSVRSWTAQLVSLCPEDPHLVLEPCGHARLPKLASHQKLGGRPVYTVRDRHARECAPMRAAARPGRGRVGEGEGEGYVKGSPIADASREAGADGLKAKLGDFADMMATVASDALA